MIVKVKYYSESKGKYSDREYTYLSEEPLLIGDIVTVPVRDTTGKALVTAINVPESEIEAFKDKIKTIPSGSLIDVVPITGRLELCPDEEQPDPLGDFLPPPTFDPISSDNAVAVVQIKPEITPGFVQLKDQVDSLAKYADLRVIKSDEDIKPATDDLVLIRKVAKAIDELRRSYTDPLNNHVKTINATFKQLSDPLSQADKTTLSKIKTYRDLVEKKRQEAEELNRLKEEIARKEAELSGTGEFTIDTTPVIVPQVSRTVKTNTGTLGGRKVRKARVINFAQLDDMYKLPNEKLLDAAAKSGVKEIPGVEFYFEEVCTVRSK